MRINPARLLQGALWRAGKACFALSERVPYARRENGHELSDVLEQQGDWLICRVGGFIWRLDPSQFIDRMLVDSGVFEPMSTKWVERNIKPGMVVADVGANFGYYTLLLSRLVGPAGQVHAFEPSSRYRERLLDHVSRNKCDNVVISECGLSDRCRDERLYGDNISAALHWADDGKTPTIEEGIRLRTLDGYADELCLPKLDFIKVDIDGHEPYFLAGAAETLRRFRPVLLIEFAQLNLMAAGSDVDNLARQLTELGYSFYSEKTGEPYTTRADFLRDAMNCSHSVNVICQPGHPRANLEE